MKQFYTIAGSFLMIALLGLFLGACTTGTEEPIDPMEPEIPPVPIPPSLSFKSVEGFLSEPTAQVRPETEFSLILKGEKGDELLTTLEVLKNGQPLTDYTIDGVPQTTNRFTLAGQEQNRFEWIFGITSEAVNTRFIYEFRLLAQDLLTDGVAITIDTDLTETTPPNLSLTNTDNVKDSVGNFAIFEVELDALGSPIKEMTVYKGANLMPVDQLKFGGDPFGSNPLPLMGNDRRQFKKNVEVEISEFGVQRHTLILTDSLEATYSLELIYEGI